jgi:hypothetical protein
MFKHLFKQIIFFIEIHANKKINLLLKLSIKNLKFYNPAIKMLKSLYFAIIILI